MVMFVFLVFFVCFFGVWDLGVGDWIDVDLFVVWLVYLKVRGVFFVGLLRKSVYFVVCIGVYEDRLLDDVVGGLVVGVEVERVFEFFVCVGVEKGCLR